MTFTIQLRARKTRLVVSSQDPHRAKKALGMIQALLWPNGDEDYINMGPMLSGVADIMEACGFKPDSSLERTLQASSILGSTNISLEPHPPDAGRPISWGDSVGVENTKIRGRVAVVHKTHMKVAWESGNVDEIMIDRFTARGFGYWSISEASLLEVRNR